MHQQITKFESVQSEITDYERNPLHISLVVDVIKDFISCPRTIRSCTLVNKTWKEVFQKKAFQILTIKSLQNVIRPFPEGLGYNKATHKFNPHVTNEINRLHVDDKKEVLYDKIVIDFFEHKGAFLKYFSLKISKWEFSAQVHFQFLKSVLLKWCPNLEELKLIGVFEHEKTTLFKNTKVKELALKKLTLDFSEIDFLVTPVTINFLHLAGNLECFEYVGNVFNEDAHNISVQLMTDMMNYSKKLTSLKFLHVTIGRDVFNVITRASWPLKSYIFKGSHLENLTVSHLNCFAMSYRNTMRHFQLDLNWIPQFYKEEFKIHVMTKLTILKINVKNVNIGAAGLLGNLQCLRRINLFGTKTDLESQHHLHDMFKYANCPSVKFIYLDEKFLGEAIMIPKLFPNFKEMEISCQTNKLDDLISCLDVLIHDNFFLDELIINVHFSETDVFNEHLSKHFIVRLCQCNARVIKVETIQGLNIFPSLRANWIEEGLFGHEHLFFSIELKGFKIPVNEIEIIVKTLTERSNFLKLVECKVFCMEDGREYFLEEVQMFSYNVSAKIDEIVSLLKDKRSYL